MSQANTLASAALFFKTTSDTEATALSIALDTELDNISPEPEPSLRMHQMADGPATLEGFTLIQLDLRLPRSLSDWVRIQMRERLRNAWGFKLKQANPRMALIPLLDFQSSDNPSTPSGNIRIELNGSQFWRVRSDGPDIELSTCTLNIFFTGD